MKKLKKLMFNILYQEISTFKLLVNYPLGTIRISEIIKTDNY